MPFDHLALGNPYAVYWPPGTEALENALDVGLRKVLADKEKRARMLLSDFIGEAVAEVQAGGIKAFAHCS